MNKPSGREIAYCILMVICLLTFSIGTVKTTAPAQARVEIGVVRYAAPGGLSSGACDSWAAACELQTALGLAAAGEEVWVRQGVYKPTSGSDPAATFQLKTGVAIYGGFYGTETVREQRDWEANLTVLSGDIDNNDITDPAGVVTSTLNIVGMNSYHVVTGSGVDATAALDGFTITAGHANGGGESSYGAGLYEVGGSPTLMSVKFVGNLAASYGGGMYNYSGSPVMTNVYFSANSGDGGGGIYHYEGTLTITNAIFSDNEGGFSAGGLGVSSIGNSTLTNVLFAGNHAAYGGGMGAGYSSPTLINATFIANNASYGGGLHCDECNAKLTNVIFSGNLAVYGGGMETMNASAPTLTNVTFSGNSATEGGGLWNTSSSPSLIQNSIFWGNAASSSGAQIHNAGSNPTIRYSLLQDCNPGGVWNPACGADGGNNLTDTDPLFIAPEPASSAPTAAGDYRLQDVSPAINVGDNLADLDGTGPGVATIQDIPADPDGNFRLVRGTVDLGAYENQNIPCPAGGVLYVDKDAAGAQTGETWSNAYASLQDALKVSGACEIWVAEGVYYPDEGHYVTQNDRTAAFQLKNEVGIYGGFAGTETAREQRDWENHVTVLSGDIDNNDITAPTGVVTSTLNIQGNNSYHVVLGSSVNSSGILDGFYITAGKANGPFVPPCGPLCGGGMYVDGSNPTLVNLTFSGNLASYGGGILNWWSSPTLTNVTFYANQASVGGGMRNITSHPHLVGVTFSSNKASQGGGMQNQDWSKPTLISVAFIGNQATKGGGMWNLNGSHPALTNVRMSGNLATYGGGIYNEEDSSPILTNVSVSGNRATLGGGIYNDYDSGNGSKIQNSIIWSNSSPQIYNVYSFPVIRYSLVDGCNPGGVWDSDCGTDGGGNLPDADPRFVNAASGDLRLTRLSPAIDAGDNAAIPPDALDLDGDGNTTEPLPYDLAGMPRFIDVPDIPDTGSGTPPIVDLGAYERGLNRAPVASGAGESYGTDEDTPLSVPAPGLLANDSDPDGDPLSAVLSSGPAHGGLTLNPDGSFTYTPALNYHGSDSFTYVASDGGLSSAIVTVNLTINSVNDLPEISEGASIPVSMDEDGASLPFSLTLHAVDVDGDVLTWSILTPAAHGTASASGTGASKAIGYSPATNYNGADSFVVQVSDGNGGVDTIQVNVTISAVNDAPLLDKPADRMINEDAAQQTVNLTGISDGDPDLLQILVVTAVSSAPGIVPNPVVTYTSPNATGTLKFTPVANANGDATITVTVTDSGSSTPPNANTVSKQFIVHVTPVNDPPAGADKTLTMLEDMVYTFTASDFGFSDPYDSPANSFNRVKVTTLPGSGALTLNLVAVQPGQFITVADINAGRLVFSPAANANGLSYTSFTFQVEDDGGTADGGVNLDPTPNTLTFNVTPVNDAPAGTDKTLTMLEDMVYTFTTSDFGFSDPNDSPANSFNRVKVTTLPGSGALTLNLVAVQPGQFITVADINAGRLVFSPAANANGLSYTSFTFQVEDDGGTANGGANLDPTPNTLTFNVTSVNDAPLALGDSYTTRQETPLTVPAPGVLGNDTDIDSVALSAILDSGPAHGVLTLNPDGSFLYTPAYGYYGADSFTYHASDGSLPSNIVTVHITVQQVHKIYLPVVLRNT